MTQALKLGGAAVFKIAHDSQWRRPNRDRKTQRLVFQELKTNWLRVSLTQLVIADFNIRKTPITRIFGSNGRSSSEQAAGSRHACQQPVLSRNADQLGRGLRAQLLPDIRLVNRP